MRKVWGENGIINQQPAVYPWLAADAHGNKWGKKRCIKGIGEETRRKKILFGKPRRKWRIILKRMLNQSVRRVWTGHFCSCKWINGGLLCKR
jgi:hypothetical protein